MLPLQTTLGRTFSFYFVFSLTGGPCVFFSEGLQASKETAVVQGQDILLLIIFYIMLKYVCKVQMGFKREMWERNQNKH